MIFTVNAFKTKADMLKGLNPIYFWDIAKEKGKFPVKEDIFKMVERMGKMCGETIKMVRKPVSTVFTDKKARAELRAKTRLERKQRQIARDKL